MKERSAMISNIRRLRRREATYESGHVVDLREDGGVVVDLSGVSVTCRAAVSCLAASRVEDHVLVTTTADGSSFILAILERPAGGVELALEGDTRLTVSGGCLSLTASEGIDIASSSHATIVAPEVRIDATLAALTFGTLAAIGSVVQGQVSLVKTVAEAIETIAGRVSQHLGRSHRVVTELDQVQAEQIDYRATETVAIRGRNTALAAESLNKLDGEQVHIG